MNRKIVCWIGNAPNHRALVARLSSEFDIVGIVIDRKKNLAPKKTAGSLVKKIMDRIRFGRIDRAWHNMQNSFRQKAAIPSNIPVLEVDNINEPAVKTFTEDLHPDLVIVSGTSLVKEPLVSLNLPIGIMNLHTGLSPFVKGGPNCTNWCIANNEWGSIGNTIMWISAGIDSGNIIVTEQTSLDDSDDLDTIHKKVMEHAHELYHRAVKYIMDNEPPYQSIPQSTLGKGNLYLSRMWTSKQKKQLLKNLSGKRKMDTKPATIPLPS